MPTPHNVTLHFGQQGVEDFNTYTGDNVDVQPAGMSFFDLLWLPPNLGTVNIVHKKHSLTIDNAISVLGSAKNPDINTGIISIAINSGLHKSEFVEPKEAYLTYRDLLARINQQGWQQYYSYSDARIAKQDNLKFIQKYNEVIDPSYVLSYEEWRQLFNNQIYHSLYYRLYLDGIIMNVTISKSGNKDDQEQYMLRFTFETAGYTGVNLIEGGYKLKGEELKIAYEQFIKEGLSNRSKQELELKEQGYTIDENYETPNFWEYMK